MKRKNPVRNRLPDAIAARPKSDFCQIRNAALRDPNLSFKATGILAVLLSNKQGWHSFSSTLESMKKEGRDALRSGLLELEKNGYLLRIEYRNKITKQWKGGFWAYTDMPRQFEIEKHLDKLERRGFEVGKVSAWGQLGKAENPSAGNPPIIIPIPKKTKNTSHNSKDPIRTIMDHWNTSAKKSGLPAIIKMTDKRRQHLAARVDEYGLKSIRKAIRSIHQSSFCRGENDRGWKATIDFLARPDTVTKALEGLYDGESGSRSGHRIITRREGETVLAGGEPGLDKKWFPAEDQKIDGTLVRVWENADGDKVACDTYPQPDPEGPMIGTRLGND